MRAWLVLLLLGSCSADRAQLLVTIKTDLVPGEEFTAARVTIERAGAAVRSIGTPVFAGDPVERGLRAAEAGGLATGSYLLHVALLRADGETVLSRDVSVHLTTDLHVTVLMTRSCLGVTCPRNGDDLALTACLGGECVDPSCTAEAGETCPDAECMRDDDCAEPAAACARALCVDGACLSIALTDACGAERWCDPEHGCRPTAIGVPPPADASDAETTEAGSGDADAGADGDATCAFEPCDPLENCGCDSPHACRIGPDGFACTETGSAPAGEACAKHADCEPSLSCEIVRSSSGVCRPYCDADDDCTNSVCLLALRGSPVGVCETVCNPLTTGDCPGGLVCRVLTALKLDGETTYTSVCAEASGGPEGAPCDDLFDCAAGETCVNLRCASICDLGNPVCSSGACRSLDPPFVVQATQYGVCR